VQVDAGVDANGNGELDDDEVRENTVSCRPGGEIVRTATLPVGATDCPSGGTRIETGRDLNGNFALDESEVQQRSAVCQSAAILLNTERLDAGDASCPMGGTRVLVGADDGLPSGMAANGILEPGEVDSAHAICSGAGELPEDAVSGGCGIHVVRSRGAAGRFGLIVMGLLLLSRRRTR
jgi:hypothetical protein